MGTVPSHRSSERRAKVQLCAFLSKYAQICSFKLWAYDFAKQMYKIKATMKKRVDSHRLKMEFLDLLFERELRSMKVHCFGKAKYDMMCRELTFKLSAITES